VEYLVVEETVLARPTAVIASATSWEAFPALWPELLSEVWETVRPRRGELAPGRNVMLYQDDVPNVEVGAEVAARFAPMGRVVSSTLPSGRVATTTHRGPFHDVGSAHAAVIGWCDDRGLERAGPRWEIYGHWDADAPEPMVDVYYLLR
jgi:effector-binding domain-containing protein